MTTRDELADLIYRTLNPEIQQPGWLPTVDGTGNVASHITADAILSRWRLVPVRPVVTFVNHPAGAPCPDDRAADELTQHDQAAGHYGTRPPANRIRGFYASAAARDVDTVLTREPGMVVMVGDDYWAWTGKAWAQVIPRTDQHGPHED